MKKKLILPICMIVASLVFSTGVKTVDANDMYRNAITNNGWTKLNGGWHYLKNGKSLTGVQKINNYIYLFNKNGKMRIGYIGDYYFQYNGKLFVGWKKYGSSYKFFNRKTARLSRGMQTIDNKRYYFDQSGLLKFGWIKYNNDWYYANETGDLRTGWLKKGDNYYYLEKTNNYNKYKMITGYKSIDGVTYRFKDSGELFDGWNRENGKYVFYKDGVKKIGWLKWHDDYYYLDKDGYMYTGEHIIEGKRYLFNNNGAYVKEIKSNNRIENYSNHSINPMKTKSSKYKKSSKKLYFVDISQHNGQINFSKLKRNVDGVILRMSWGHYALDKRFLTNLQGVKSQKIPFGVYHYSYAVNVKEAIEEAKGVINTLRKYNVNPDYPIYYDMEDADGWKKRNHGITITKDKELHRNMIIAFCETLKKAGYEPGIYTSKSWFDMLGDLSDYHIWLAHWNVPNPTIKYAGLWQFTDNDLGSLVGASSRSVDGNYAYFEPIKIR